jgi:hypothetical protein
LLLVIFLFTQPSEISSLSNRSGLRARHRQKYMFLGRCELPDIFARDYAFGVNDQYRRGCRYSRVRKIGADSSINRHPSAREKLSGGSCSVVGHSEHSNT